MSSSAMFELECPAYCLFTSGSTGEPKGCMVNHGAFASIADHCIAISVNASSRVLQFASYSFGISLIEIWCTLIAGGTVCVPAEEDRDSRLSDVINEFKVNYALLTPTVLDSLTPESVPTVKTLLVAGEPLKEFQVGRWAQAVNLYQGYGLTEWAGLFSISPKVQSSGDLGCIGCPIAGRCWLLDQFSPNKLAGIGTVAELAIEGPSLAQAYINDPARTSTSFLESPQWMPNIYEEGHNKKVIYRTGDLVYYDSQGNLRYVCRKDSQVKIRGQRVELRAIETQIGQNAVVEDIRPVDDTDQSVLVAFVPVKSLSVRCLDIHEQAGNVSTARVDEAFKRSAALTKKRLEAQLPNYMVPSIFIPVQTMPLTISGKVDRLKLRTSVSGLSRRQILELAGLRHGVIMPSTEQEQTLHRLIVDLLNLKADEVGMEQDFISLGGDSVMAMRLVGKARHEGLHFTVQDVFKMPVLRELALVAKVTDREDPRPDIKPFSLLEPTSREATVALAAQVCRVRQERVEDVYPCTPLQEGMMILGAQQKGKYIARFVYRLEPTVDLARLRAAWDQTVIANPILRTRIIETDGKGMRQVVVRETIVLTNVAEAQPVPTSFGDRLINANLIEAKDGHSDSFMILTMHHAICDRWSVQQLMCQLESAYKGVAPSPNSFSRFIQHIQDMDTTAAEAYWKSQFSSLEAEAFPKLPSKDYRPNATESMTQRIDPPYGTPTGFTMSTILRLALAIVIAHYSSSPDVVFGATVTGRAAPVHAVETLTAPTVATIPVRVKLDPSSKITDALDMIQTQTSEMTAFEQTGLQAICKCSPEADTACRFQTHLIVQPSWDATTHTLFAPVTEGATTAGGFTAYALVVLCNLMDNSSVNVTAEFDTGVLSTNEMTWILKHFQHVVLHLLTNPEQKISHVPTMSDFEVDQLRQWNRTLPSTISSCVHEIIRQRCIDNPSSSAICAWDGDFAFDELDLWSARLSTFLVHRGVGPDVFVPILFQKSRWAIVAMLGVMKAGGAFVMLDPIQPRQRLMAICKQINGPVLISHMENEHLAAMLHPKTVILDENIINMLSTNQQSVPEASARPDAALYAVFTSGTTGTPKGVVIEHRSYCSGAMAHIEACGMSSQTRMLQFASYSFDTSSMEILSTLMAGGCVCVPSEHGRKNDLANEAARLKITHAILTPSLARPLLSTSTFAATTIIVVGEPMTRSDVSQWTRHYRLMNGYGPSECSVNATLQPNSGTGPDIDPANIGFPTGAVCWIVHPENHNILRPIGAVGELLIEGPIVGRGYLNDPDRTRASFVSAPPWLRDICPREGGTRLYKTGDLVKYTKDGSVVYVGRNDTQVKLRGQRIELGEVEDHIRRCIRGIVDVVVEKVQPSAPTDSPCLVAFVVTQQQTPDNNAEAVDLFAKPTDSFAALAAACHTKLLASVPEYMVPEIFIPLSSTPRTVSGKTDRRHLRSKASQLSFVELSAFRSPRPEKQMPINQAEHVLQAVWSQVLNRPLQDVGRNDSFYQLGGDSISAMQVVALASSKNLFTSVEDILRFKTIADIVDQGRRHTRPDIRTGHSFGVPFDLAPIQQLFFERQSKVTHRFNQEFLVCVTRRVSLDQLRQGLQTIISRHPMLCSVFLRQSNGQWQQMLRHMNDSNSPCVHHSVVRRDAFDAALTATRRSLNIESGPVFAAHLVDVPDDERQYLFLVAHHLVIDLVSWRIIFADLESTLKEGPLCAPPSVSFQTWCSLQDQFCRESLPPAQALPKALPQNHHTDPKILWGLSGRANTFGDIATERFTVDWDVSQQLLGGANQAFNTRSVEIFNAIVLYSFAGVFQDRPPPLVFSEGHGREPWDRSIDLAQTVGWFTTLWPVIVDMQKGEGFIQILRLVKDAYRQIPKNGWAYFASRYLHPEGRQSLHTPYSAEIIFNYTGEYQQFEQANSLFQSDIHTIQGALDAADDVERLALFDVTISVSHGCLQFHFIYNRHMLHQQAIQDWIQACKLNATAACRSLCGRPCRPTVCDFPLMSLSYHQLDEFIDNTLQSMGFTWDDVEDCYPCSPAQQGMLVAQAKDAGSYMVQVTWKIESMDGQEMDLLRLKRSWEEVVKRHAILRTILVDGISGGSYLDQVVLKATSPKLLPNRCARSGQTKGELLYTMTFSDNEGNGCVCQLEVNHAIIDAASLDILKRDLISQACDECLPGWQRPLYSDFLRYLHSQPSEPAHQYWKAYLHGVQPCHFPSLVADHPGPAALRHVSKRLPNGPQIHKFCKESEITIWNIVCLAWTFVLRCYTYAEQVCFGVVKSSRDLPISNVEHIVGPILNMLPFYLSLDGTEIADQVLQTIKQDYLASLQYQTVPLSDIHQLAQTSQQPLFNTAVTVQRAHGWGDKSNGRMRIETLSKDETTEYDLLLSVDYTDDTIDVQLRYKTGTLFEPHARSVLATFEEALSSVVLNSKLGIDQINLVGCEDQALIRSRNSSLPATVESCIHDMIDLQCSKRPHATAVCAWDGDFTFHEIKALSSRLGSHLTMKGVCPEAIVPICLEKSRWTVVAMLGVLKTGGAFVLLDPSHPYARLRTLCERVCAKVILSSQEKVELSRKLCDDVVIVSTDGSSLWSDTLMTNSARPAAQPSNAAYIIFTSGSTGTPKAVVIEHRAFCTGALSQIAALHLNEATRFAQFSSFAFDICILEHFATLMAGGCICVLSESQRQDRLEEHLQSLHATHALLVPSVARLLSPTENTLSTLILGGECMSQTDVSTWADRVRLLNIYGPAECSVISTVQASVRRGSDPRNIGHPCGCVCWIVDSYDVNKLMPNGAVGELLIEGPIVARGYLDDIERTAEAFVRPPAWFGDRRKPSSFYRTGDLARFNVDGSLTFLGRRDMQVKLRGQRIELEEVEAHVRWALDGAVDVVAEVAVPEGVHRNPVLVAFVLFLSNDATSPADGVVLTAPSTAFYTKVAGAKTKLQQSVPSMLVPSIFVPILRLPRTASGKIDRKSLRQTFEAFSPDDLANFRTHPSAGPQNPPSTEVEHKLRQIWAEALALSPYSIGLSDNLFHLGGDSIDAMKVAALSRTAGIPVSVASIFAAPTLEDLAKKAASTTLTETIVPRSSFSMVRSEVRNYFTARLATHEPSARDPVISDVLPATEVQRFFIERRTLHYYNFAFCGNLDSGKLRRACEVMMARYAILRTLFMVYEGDLFQVILNTLEAPFGHHHHKGNDLRAFAQQLWADDRSQFNILTGPAIRFILVSGSGPNHIFSIRISHAQWDGVSFPCLVHDLMAAYNGISLRPTSDFADYQYYRAAHSGANAFAFWERYLRDGAITSPFEPRNPVDCLPGEEFTTRWHVEAIARPRLPLGITMATLVKAACAWYIACLTSQDDIIIGQTVNARSLPMDHIDVVLGPCLNFIPFRVAFHPQWTILDLLKSVRAQYTETLGHEFVEFRDIVRNATNWPENTQFGVIVQHQNIQLRHDMDLGGIQAEYSLFPQFDPRDEVFIFTEPYHNRLEVQVCSSTRILSPERGRSMAQGISATIERFSRSSEMLVSDLRTMEGLSQM
ncbi:nonribosomal peptide synthase, putative [Aspergillus lentulus]|uniref:putative nonribosomal peptide synthase n=1 Tax=Aspergillus lentulus TaxID=293939 RepID=UPI001394F9BA|nr:nonribosomal peptide synthase, putative [Aspergillus lentulus]GFF52330.1 nonribosomal peptide synthase, putative [Aspergillus lentulus]